MTTFLVVSRGNDDSPVLILADQVRRIERAEVPTQSLLYEIGQRQPHVINLPLSQVQVRLVQGGVRVIGLPASVAPSGRDG